MSDAHDRLAGLDPDRLQALAEGRILPCANCTGDLLYHDGTYTHVDDACPEGAQPETCEERGYRCCELMPPGTGLTNEQYLSWYDRHVANYYAKGEK